jgi:hypothetical protein
VAAAAVRQIVRGNPLQSGMLGKKADVSEIALVGTTNFDDGVHSAIVEQVNRFQAKYHPKSKVGTPIAVTPTNMAAVTQAALDRVEEMRDHKFDAWVANELGFEDVAEMAFYLSPEQVDAVALAMTAAENENGFILADQTGLGKGRVLAALVRWAARNGKTVVFLTEKANLFSDFWRDVVDTGSDKIIGEPLLLNAGAKIFHGKDERGKPMVLHASPKEKVLKEIVKSGELPPGCKLLMATYSQFNNKKSPKVEFLRKVVDGAHLFLDESHNAVGDSNTAETIGHAVRSASATTFSSATFARNAENMVAYAPVFPKSLSALDLVEVLKAGGPPLLEALSQMLAEAGFLVRREHDLSNIKIEVREDIARVERNRQFADAMSPILSAMARLALKTKDIIEEKNTNLSDEARKLKENWYTVEFGTRLAAISRQFLAALKVDMCVEECVQALLRGEKPVVVIESTMESLMRELASDKQGSDDELNGEDGQPELFDENEDGEVDATKRPPNFRDALRVMLERMKTLSVKRKDCDPEKVGIEDQDFLRDAAVIEDMIAGFPDLSLSPIDDVRSRVEEIGRRLHAQGKIDRPWVFGEISARSLRVENGTYVPMEEKDRQESISEFQDGQTDGLVITRAASTGLSLHASEKAIDQRPRIMIELQIPSNVVERVQFWGRVNRRGQVVEPKFMSLSTGLPFEIRIQAVQNRKVAELSANVSASTESATSMDVPDVINSVGNAVCKRILDERPNIAARMGISLRVDPVKAETELYFVNKYLSRLMLLPSDMQDKLFDEMIAHYNEIVKELEAKGQHPTKARELAGQWKVVKREIFDPGNPADGPVVGRPVYVTTIEAQVQRQPMSSFQVAEMVRATRARHEAEYGGWDQKALLAQHRNFIKDHREQILARSLPRKYKTVSEALKGEPGNAVLMASAKLKEMLEVFNSLQAGQRMMLTNDDGEQALAVITDIRLPPFEEAHLPSAYIIQYAFPGEEQPREISLAGMLRDEKLYFYQDNEKVMRELRNPEFDAAPRGSVTVQRKVLDGNLFNAVKSACDLGFGTMAGFTDDQGRRRRGVLIPQSKQAKLESIPVASRHPGVIIEVLAKTSGPIYTNVEERGEGLILREYAKNPGMVTIIKPGKKQLSKPFDFPEVEAMAGQKFKGDWRGVEITVPRDVAEQIIGFYADHGITFHFDGKHRTMAVLAAQSLAAQEKNEEEPEPENHRRM